MYFLGHCQKILVSIPLFSASLTLAQGTTYETIYSLDSWSSQKPCAQQCFINTSLGCHIDEVAAAIGCEYNDCSANYGAPNDCYCRADLQSVAQSYLTSCVSAQCTVGDSSIDISSAGSIYNYYCSSNGFPAAAVVATTTLPATQATPTVYVTVYRSIGISARSILGHSTAWNIWELCFFFWSLIISTQNFIASQ